MVAVAPSTMPLQSSSGEPAANPSKSPRSDLCWLKLDSSQRISAFIQQEIDALTEKANDAPYNLTVGTMRVSRPIVGGDRKTRLVVTRVSIEFHS